MLNSTCHQQLQHSGAVFAVNKYNNSADYDQYLCRALYKWRWNLNSPDNLPTHEAVEKLWLNAVQRLLCVLPSIVMLIALVIMSRWNINIVQF